VGVTGVTIQSTLPLILRGSGAAMTNLTDPLRYNLLSIPTPTGDAKADAAIAAGNETPYAPKLSRDMLYNQYKNLQGTLNAFADINFTEAGNTYQDDVKTDGDTAWVPPAPSGGRPAGDPSRGYYLFPTTADINGGWRRSASQTDANKYVVPTNLHDFFYRLKAAALVLNHTSAIIAGTEYGGFDTHQGQGQLTGQHPDLNRGIGWAMYALHKYFTLYPAQCTWNNLVVVTLTEFGRTTIENNDRGTDHAEGGVMWVAGGSVKGYGKGNPSGVFNCSPNEAINSSMRWVDGPSGSMFGVSGRYLSRNTDFRSVLGEIIRKHLGATQNQLNRILPGYANPGEGLLAGGTSSIDGRLIRGEVGFL
jgi:hypothetical protein